MKQCSMCGKEFDIFDKQLGFTFDKYIGYGSIHDMDRVKLNLCCECFDKLIDILNPICCHEVIVESD